MTCLSRRSLLQIAIATGIAARLPAAEQGWEELFDGHSLSGWRVTARSPHSKASGQRSGGYWRVEDGQIVGSQDTPGNGGLLLTEKLYGNFEVSLEVNNAFGPDSGLFMSCTEDGKAYQCLIDYHEGGTIGGILGEGIWKRRGVRNFTFGSTPDRIEHNENAEHPCPILADAWPYFWRVGQWNEVRARITGDPPTITTWVNGVQIMQHTEPESVHPTRGHLGLQVHGGNRFGGEVRYRRLRIRQIT
jgi:hypothetical protein